jgi:hypothetical protein
VVRPKRKVNELGANVRGFGGIVRAVGAGWLGLTTGCAECHDHKFDPFTARDFYALGAFFADIDDENHMLGGGRDRSPTIRSPEIDVVGPFDRAAAAELDARIEPLARAALQRAP